MFKYFFHEIEVSMEVNYKLTFNFPDSLKAFRYGRSNTQIVLQSVLLEKRIYIILIVLYIFHNSFENNSSAQ